MESVKRYADCVTRAPVRLFRHKEQSMAARLSAMAERAGAFASPDFYGKGDLICSFEREMARLFNKSAALFLPSGTMAQCIALKIIALNKNNPHFAIHPTSHLYLHEHDAWQSLWHLQAHPVGDLNAPIGLSDLLALGDLPATVLTEVPAREIGGQLPPWEDLVAQSQWARTHGVNFHLDGARIWCAEAVYQRSFAEIGGLFDVLYLSFYKDLDGISGAMLLAEDEAFMDEARRWRRRCGGDLIHHYPAILAAQIGIETHLARMPDYVAQAQCIARLFQQHRCFELVPRQPLTNLFHIIIRYPKEAVLDILYNDVLRERVAILPVPRNPEPEFCRFEITVGNSQSQLPIAGWQSAIERLAGAIRALQSEAACR